MLIGLPAQEAQPGRSIIGRARQGRKRGREIPVYSSQPHHHRRRRSGHDKHMNTRDYSPLLAELGLAYGRYSPKSAELSEKAKAFLVDGGSHAMRLMGPFPPRFVSAQGARGQDEDGHQVLDFWQGHLAHVLGHNPEVITTVLSHAFHKGMGLQTGLTDSLEIEAAELLCRQTGAERVRFTTSGALATMYAILLARAFTGRDLLLKAGGGWHGAQPWGLKGVSYHAGDGQGYEAVDSEGLPSGVAEEVMVTRFNDPGMLRDQFRRRGDRIARFIVEPCLGGGGVLSATREYLQTAREITQEYGALLILDEVIAGFRYRAGDAGAFYEVRPDLATFGKIIGGGMPVAAVAGRADVLALTGIAGNHRVAFSGGTYSAHPASMLAARTMMEYLVTHESELYHCLAILGQKTRQAAEAAFAEGGISAKCTGGANDTLPESSLFMIHFPYNPEARLKAPTRSLTPPDATSPSAVTYCSWLCCWKTSI